MEKELFDYVAERAGILATADTSKQETKDAAAAWKDAVAADSSDAAVEAATTKLLDFPPRSMALSRSPRARRRK